jgi:hypothetical protein
VGEGETKLGRRWKKRRRPEGGVAWLEVRVFLKGKEGRVLYRTI